VTRNRRGRAERQTSGSPSKVATSRRDAGPGRALCRERSDLIRLWTGKTFFSPWLVKQVIQQDRPRDPAGPALWDHVWRAARPGVSAEEVRATFTWLHPLPRCPRGAPAEFEELLIGVNRRPYSSPVDQPLAAGTGFQLRYAAWPVYFRSACESEVACQSLTSDPEVEGNTAGSGCKSDHVVTLMPD